MEPFEQSTTTDEYVRALGAISGTISDPQRALLRAMYAARDRPLSPGELAKLVGYKSRQPLNKVLLNLADMLRDELRLRVPDPQMVLASMEQSPGHEPKLKMLPALASALEILDWVGDK